MKKIAVKLISKHWKLNEKSSSVIVFNSEQNSKIPYNLSDIDFEESVSIIYETEPLILVELTNGKIFSLLKEKEIKKTIRVKELDSDLTKVIK